MKGFSKNYGNIVIAWVHNLILQCFIKTRAQQIIDQITIIDLDYTVIIGLKDIYEHINNIPGTDLILR